MVAGKANKEVASELGISEITVKPHRGNMMRKMEAEPGCQTSSVATESEPLEHDLWSDATGQRMSAVGGWVLICRPVISGPWPMPTSRV